MRVKVGLVGRWLVVLVLALLMVACNEPDLGNFNTGLTNQCRAQGAFVNRSGLQQPVALDSRQKGYKGLRLISMRDQKTWQHPTWDDVGHIGAFARDRKGNIYVASVPSVSISKAMTEGLANQLYRIDTKTGVLAFFMDIPAAASFSTANPFGIMGLSYDCDTDSLYVSSIAGSTADQVAGRIYQVDVANRKIISQLEQTDALALTVFNGAHKRLYLGSARSPDVYSVVLDAKGQFTSDVRHEFSLATLSGGSTSNARKLVFTRNKQGQFTLQVKEMEFGFRLLAENNLLKRVYQFGYQKESDDWTFLGAVPER